MNIYTLEIKPIACDGRNALILSRANKVTHLLPLRGHKNLIIVSP